MAEDLESRLRMLEDELNKSREQKHDQIQVFKHKRLTLTLLMTIVILLLCTIVYSYTNRNSSTGRVNIRSSFESIANMTPYPFYYPSSLPDGYSVDSQSLTVQNAYASFTLHGQDAKLVVVEQPKPPIMEQVTKVTDLNIPYGSAYIANVAGIYTGFIVADKTLVVISGAKESQIPQLKELIYSFKKL